MESHCTLSIFSDSIATSLVSHGMEENPLEHSPDPAWHLYPLGQQWTWSLQQTAFGTGQHPHCPVDSLQHVFPLGHSCVESHLTFSTVTSLLSATSFVSQGIEVIPFMHSPVPLSQVYPLGQQCTWSLQHSAFGTGQHPHCPEDSLQQVFPSGHSCMESHCTPSTFSDRIATSLVSHGMEESPLVHSPVPAEQVYPLGQQWVWSLQHTALGTGQHPH